VPALFEWLQRTGDVPDGDMLRTFNMGVGLIVVCAPADARLLIEKLTSAGEPGAVRIGEIQAGAGVTYV
jgi:phosphoribosylformylglycinamidine cyclo-ligase